MVGGEVAGVVAVPGTVVLVVLHEFALAVEILALLGEGALPALVEPAHLVDFLRHLLPDAGEGLPRGGQGRIGVDHRGAGGLLLQHDGVAPLALGDGLVQQAEHGFRLGAPVEGDAHPVGALHAEGLGEERRRALGEHLLAAAHVAPLDFLPRVGVPLAHQEGGPLAGDGVGQDREAGEIRPRALLPHVKF